MHLRTYKYHHLAMVTVVKKLPQSLGRHRSHYYFRCENISPPFPFLYLEDQTEKDLVCMNSYVLKDQKGSKKQLFKDGSTQRKERLICETWYGTC